MIELIVNGCTHRLGANPATPLLYALSEHVGVTSLTFGCGTSACGACAVHVNGRVVRACEVALSTVAGAQVVTIEGLAASEGLPSGVLHPVQQAWIDAGVPPCRCRHSGLMMAAAALLARQPDPSDADIDAALAACCPCETRREVRHAIRLLAQRLATW